jgi:hypothetical protein
MADKGNIPLDDNKFFAFFTGRSIFTLSVRKKIWRKEIGTTHYIERISFPLHSKR